MCGPSLAWDWLVFDVAFVLTVTGGTMVLRARMVSPFVWVLFGTLSVLIGGLLLGGTYFGQTLAASPGEASDAATLLASC